VTWEEAAPKLQPGDILLYRPKPGIGSLISWGEWTGASGEALEYSHAGLVVDPLQDWGFEQNPPETHNTVLSREDWSVIDIWRVKAPVDKLAMTRWIANDLGTPYPYAKYFRFLGAAMLARVGLSTLAQKVDAGGGQNNPHWAVCSATVCMALSAACPGTKLWPKIDEDMRPCDIPLGSVERVA
jgi:hypothetical protein